MIELVNDNIKFYFEWNKYVMKAVLIFLKTTQLAENLKTDTAF